MYVWQTGGASLAEQTGPENNYQSLKTLSSVTQRGYSEGALILHIGKDGGMCCGRNNLVYPPPPTNLMNQLWIVASNVSVLCIKTDVRL